MIQHLMIIVCPAFNDYCLDNDFRNYSVTLEDFKESMELLENDEEKGLYELNKNQLKSVIKKLENFPSIVSECDGYISFAKPENPHLLDENEIKNIIDDFLEEDD